MKDFKLNLKSIGLVSPLGCTTKEILESLKSPPAPNKGVYLSGGHEINWHYYEANEYLKPLIKSYKKARRANYFTKLAVGAVECCLNATQTIDEPPGVILCTSFGPMNTAFSLLDSIVYEGEDYVSPMAFTNSLPNCAVGTVTSLFEWTSPSISITTHNTPFFQGLILAKEWLGRGIVKEIILIMVEEYCPVFAPGMADIYPGLFLTEGAVAWLLTNSNHGAEVRVDKDIPAGQKKGIDLGAYLGGSPFSDIMTLSIAAMIQDEIDLFCKPSGDKKNNVYKEKKDSSGLLNMFESTNDYHLTLLKSEICDKLN